MTHACLFYPEAPGDYTRSVLLLWQRNYRQTYDKAVSEECVNAVIYYSGIPKYDGEQVADYFERAANNIRYGGKMVNGLWVPATLMSFDIREIFLLPRHVRENELMTTLQLAYLLVLQVCRWNQAYQKNDLAVSCVVMGQALAPQKTILGMPAFDRLIYDFVSKSVDEFCYRHQMTIEHPALKEDLVVYILQLRLPDPSKPPPRLLNVASLDHLHVQCHFILNRFHDRRQYDGHTPLQCGSIVTLGNAKNFIAAFHERLEMSTKRLDRHTWAVRMMEYSTFTKMKRYLDQLMVVYHYHCISGHLLLREGARKFYSLKRPPIFALVLPECHRRPDRFLDCYMELRAIVTAASEIEVFPSTPKIHETYRERREKHSRPCIRMVMNKKGESSHFKVKARYIIHDQAADVSFSLHKTAILFDCNDQLKLKITPIRDLV